MNYDAICWDMIKALEEEIDSIKKSGGSNQIALSDGTRTGHIGTYFIYTFFTNTEVTITADTPAHLRVDNQSYEVSLISVEGFELRLAIRDDLGERVPQASLSLSPYFLLELLKKRLQESVSDQLSVNREMALRLFNCIPNEDIDPGSSIDFPPINGKLPNSEQRKAVEKAMKQRITFIWGPPGTGKTTTISYLAPLLARRGERILIASHTNAAVDAVIRAAVKGFSPSEIERDVVVRIGSPSEQGSDIQHVTLDAIVEKRSVELKKRQAILQEELAVAEKEQQLWIVWDSRLRAVADLTRRNEEIHVDLDAAIKRCHDFEQQVAVLRQRCLGLESDLVVAQNSGFLRRLFTGITPEKIETQLKENEVDTTRAEAEVRTYREDVLPQLRASAVNIEEALRKAYADLQQWAPVPTEEEVAKQLAASGETIDELKTDLHVIEKKLEAIAETVIREARVVGATLSKLCTMSELYMSTFDTVILDEASMIPQPHVWFAGGIAAERVVILGDFRQLPPISVAENSPVAQRRMCRDIFSESGILDENDKVCDKDPRLVTLSEQYRMHDDIGELVNALVYERDGNLLRHSAHPDKVKTGLKAFPKPGSALVFCNTSRFNPWCARQVPTYSRYNIYSALVTLRLAQKCVEGNKALTVGIACPYNAQARLIQSLVEENGLAGQVQVASIHRFQGNEKDIIIVDLVDGPPFRPGVLLTRQVSKRLLNVAFSRAKGKLILVSNSGFFTSRQCGEVLETSHQYFDDNADSIDSEDILGEYGDLDILRPDPSLRVGQKLGNPQGIAWYHEGNFYEAFTKDMMSAETEVVIFSPFVRAERTAQIMQFIQHLLRKQVTVCLMVRKESGGEGSEQIWVTRELEDAGVTVIRRQRLHEKLAFIDERIAWFGSLNIFSQSRSSEQMIRFDNPQIVGKLRELSGVTSLFRQREKEKQKEEFLRGLSQALGARMSTPQCAACGQLMVLRTGRLGPFFGCQGYPGCREIVNIPRIALASAIDDMEIVCPGCGIGQMRLKWGRKGPFLGCDRYPEDRTTLSLW